MLQLRAFARPDRAAAVERRLAELEGVRHVVSGGHTEQGLVQITAELPTDVADAVLALLQECELTADDVTLWRTRTIQPLTWRRRKADRGDSTVWAEVSGRAGDNARPALLYLLDMAAAGVVAGVGVLDGSSILVVGAMALSPDLLPISAAAVGLVDRRWRLAGRALTTLVLGLLVTTTAAMATTLLLRWSGRISSDLDLATTVLGPSLTRIGPGSVLVALAAGMAGILAYETGGAAVGVAISVTTIPAAAYLGDAIGMTRHQDGLGALFVLAVNIVCIVTAGALTLWVQRRRRVAEPHVVSS